MKFQNPSLNFFLNGRKDKRTDGRTHKPKPICSPLFQKQPRTRFDVYETLCPQQMLVHKGGQIKNWSGECRDVIPT